MSSIIQGINQGTRFFCYYDGIDIRKGIHSLYQLIKMRSDISALSGDCFVFIGSTRKSLKILWRQKDGFAMHYKKLKIGSYDILKQSGDSLFFELKSSDVDHIINNVRYKSIVSELRLKAILNI